MIKVDSRFFSKIKESDRKEDLSGSMKESHTSTKKEEVSKYLVQLLF